MNRSGMYGNRGGGRFGNQQGLLGNGGLMMGNQMSGMANLPGMANLQLFNQGGGQRDLRGGGGAGLFAMNPAMNPSLGMREMQQPGGFNISNRMNMSSQAQDTVPVLDILVIEC